MNKNVQSDAKVVIIWILNKLFCVFYYCCPIKDFDIWQSAMFELFKWLLNMLSLL